MNSGVKTALVIGGGFSGMTAAVQLSRQGVAVDLVEIDPGWRSYGACISLHGSTLCVLRDLELLKRFLEEGYATDGVELRGPDDKGLATLPTPRVARPDGPGGGAIMRPALARILKEAVQKERSMFVSACPLPASSRTQNPLPCASPMERSATMTW